MPPSTAYWAQPPRSVDSFGSSPLFGRGRIVGARGSGVSTVKGVVVAVVLGG